MSGSNDIRNFSNNVPVKNFTESNRIWTKSVLWAVFFIYIILSGYTIAHHEMWGDEIHSWNIAKGSVHFVDLIRNSRYEGHPPAWYVILWIISQFTHDLAWVQAVHLAIASLSVFIILFFSPFPFMTRMLLPFGYFFLFEYAVISRNYAIGILLVFCICLIIRKNFRYKLFLYYTLLFLLTNTHLLAILLAGSLHLYFLLLNMEQKKKRGVIVLHILLGMLIVLPAINFIFPPADSQLNMQFWLNRWNVHRLTAFIQAPLQAFLPVPAWWNYNSWNTQFLIEAKNYNSLFRFINLFIAIILPVLAFYILRRNKKSQAVFFTNFALSFMVALTVITLTAVRHAGFIYIAFIAAVWLYCYETPVTPKFRWLLNSLLIIQIAGGAFAIVKDTRYPFSNLYRVNEFLNQIPGNEKSVTDYWTLNAIAAFADRSFYCIDMQKEISFVLWNKELEEVLKKKDRYTEGISNYFVKEAISKLYMISTASPGTLLRTDPQLFITYRVILINKAEEAIEKSGNLYLYQVSSRGDSARY